MSRYAMVIDLHRCTACGGCIIACKNENNLEDGVLWSNKINGTSGTFPNVSYSYIPTLCNHCSNAPCVAACPTEAMHKVEGGITMHDPDKCIGCRYCKAICPYGVIHYNADEPHKFWRDDKAMIAGVTSSAKEVTQQVGGNVTPYYNPDREATLAGIRPQGVVEKCTFCDHRVASGKLPYCVVSCPADARIFGDLDDPNSKVSMLLARYDAHRLREDLGTEPNVYYIRSFNAGGYEKTKGGLG